MPKPKEGLQGFAELFENPTCSKDKQPDDLRNMVGTSLSQCLQDIVDGVVPESRVALIVTSTRHPFNAEGHMDKHWHPNEVEILTRLWGEGRIHQPRMVSDEYEAGEHGTVLQVPYPDSIGDEGGARWYELVPLTRVTRGRGAPDHEMFNMEDVDLVAELGDDDD